MSRRSMTLGERIALIIVTLVAITVAATSMCRRSAPPPVSVANSDSTKVNVHVDTSHCYAADRPTGKRRKAKSDTTRTTKLHASRHRRPTKSAKTTKTSTFVRNRTLTPEQEFSHTNEPSE